MVHHHQHRHGEHLVQVPDSLLEDLLADLERQQYGEPGDYSYRWALVPTDGQWWQGGSTPLGGVNPHQCARPPNSCHLEPG